MKIGFSAYLRGSSPKVLTFTGFREPRLAGSVLETVLWIEIKKILYRFETFSEYFFKHPYTE